MSLRLAVGLHEGEGDTFTPEIGPGTGTVSPQGEWIEGVHGAALSRTTAAGTHSVLSGLSSLDTGSWSAITVMAWVRPVADSGNRYPLVLLDGDDQDWLGWTIYGNSSVETWLQSTNLGPGGTAPEDTWTHLATTWDGTTIRLYVDGTLVGSIAHTGTLPDLGSITVASAPWSLIGGGIDDLRVYDEALDAAAITALMDFAAGEEPQPLSVDVGADQSLVVGQVASLTATPANPVGAVTYAWTKISGPAGSFSAPAAAATAFTPSGVGTYVLRCVVSDTVTTAQDDLVVTVTTAPTLVGYATVSAPGWTRVGGSSVLDVLSDNDIETLIVSPENPSEAVVDGYLPPMSAPGPGQSFVTRAWAGRDGLASATVVARLYQGDTLRSTVTRNIPATLGPFDITFPAVDVATIPSAAWVTVVEAGRTAMRVQLSFSGSA